MTESCPCGATYRGDPFNALNFRDAHKPCREAWAKAQLERPTAGPQRPTEEDTRE